MIILRKVILYTPEDMAAMFVDMEDHREKADKAVKKIFEQKAS